MAESGNGSPVGLSLRELVMEIRSDVKALDQKLDQIREEIVEHETRISTVEDTTKTWKYGIPPALLAGLSGLTAALFGVRAN